MSPYIRSMLEDAADDSGRPVTTDLEQIRSAGRRAVWRRRGVVGAGGLGVVAVVTSIALVVPSIGGTPGGSAGPAGSSASQSNPVQEAGSAASFGLTPAVEPLFEAIRAAGYEVGGDGSHGTSGMSGSSEGSAGSVPSTEMMSMITSSLPITKDDAGGALVVAEFTDVRMLGSATRGPDNQDPQCAISPRDVGSSDFAWRECDKQSAGEVQVWRASGGGTEGDAIGVTVVRADFSGISITLDTAAQAMVTSDLDMRSNPRSGSSWFGYMPVPPTPMAAPADAILPEAADGEASDFQAPPGPEEPGPGDDAAGVDPPLLERLVPLSELPLTLDALADIVASVAASGTVFA